MHTNIDEIKMRIQSSGIESLNEQELTFLINYELLKNDSEMDIHLIELCTKQLESYNNDISPLTIQKLINQAIRKIEHQKIISKATKHIAIIIIILMVMFPLNNIADAYGYNILNNIAEWGKTIKFIPYNKEINDTNISILKTSFKNFEDIDDLTKSINYPFQYLSYIPVDIIQKNIYLTNDNIHFIYNNSDLYYSISNKNDIDKVILTNTRTYVYKNLTFYINTINNTTIANWLFSDKYYTINYPDEDEVIKMINNLIIKEKDK